MSSSIPTQRKLLVWLLMVLVMIAVGVISQPNPAGAGHSEPTTTVVYIATGENFPDALGAAAAAAVGLGPVLLVQQNAVPSPTLAELNRLQPPKIVIVGGTAVISNAVQGQLQGLGFSPTVIRLAGANRYATAAELSAATFPIAVADHDHLGDVWTGSGAGLRAESNALGGPNAPLAGVNTGAGTADEVTFGVYGEATTYSLCSPCYPANPTGVFGRNPAGGHAVAGYAGTNTDLWKPVGSVGVVGIGDSRGVYGSAGSSYGLYGTSLNWYGVYGRTSRIDNNYGVYTPDNAFVGGSLTNLSGTFATVMQNGDSQALAPGDVVVFSGMGSLAADAGDSPVPTVTRASTFGSAAVAGVVLSGFDPAAANLEPDDLVTPPNPTPSGTIGPGSYLLVVVFGPARVNVSADEAVTLGPGDMLTTSSDAGAATAVDNGGVDITGAVLGKVLGAAEEGLWVFVTLR
ncbi:MAG TPA: cell wall-binding repeat-containing protein [Acidimicrobiia bacterium]|jgi:hypothetical protein